MNLLYISADMTVTYNDATADSTALTTGTCTYALKTADGTAVSIGTGTLTHSSAGDYAGVIESTVTATLTENALYRLEITFVQGAYNDFRRLLCKAVYRGT